jgi:peptidyl-prolyl cis-trans isomerase C
MQEIQGRASLAVLMILGTLLFMALLSFQARTWSQPPGDESPPLVQINNEILTVKEFQDMTVQLPPVLRASLQNEEGRRKALDWVVDLKLALAEALQSGVEKEPEVQAKIAAARDKIILSEYFNRLAKEKIVVSEAELQGYYTKNREEFKLSEAIRISQILVRSEKEAREILQDLKKGADFARLAKEKSVDPSRRNGGQMGWLERKVMDPDFAKAASALAKSEISGVVRTKLGHHVIRVDDTRPPTYAEYATVKPRVAEEIRRQRVQELMEQLKKDLRSEARVVMNEAGLQALKNPTQQGNH